MGTSVYFKIIILLIFAATCRAAGVEVKKNHQHEARYPWISIADGKSTWTDKEDKVHPLRRKDRLYFKAVIKTEAGAKLRIELDANSSLFIFAESQVELPVIAWEDGRLEKISLQWGRIAYSCDGDCKNFFETVISQNILQSGQYVMTYYPTMPRVKLSVVQGASSFRGLANEKSSELKAGQEAQFRGLFENGEIAFDTLLRGRRIAKGQLDPVSEISADDLLVFKKIFATKKEALKVVAAAKLKPTEKQICRSPFAEYGQCVWACENNKVGAKDCNLSKPGVMCSRRRCNANGEWADRRELTLSKNRCGPRPSVGICDGD